MSGLATLGAQRPLTLSFVDDGLEKRYQVDAGRESLAGFLIITVASGVIWAVAAVLLPATTNLPVVFASVVPLAHSFARRRLDVSTRSRRRVGGAAVARGSAALKAGRAENADRRLRRGPADPWLTAAGLTVKGARCAPRRTRRRKRRGTAPRRHQGDGPTSPSCQHAGGRHAHHHPQQQRTARR